MRAVGIQEAISNRQVNTELPAVTDITPAGVYRHGNCIEPLQQLILTGCFCGGVGGFPSVKPGRGAHKEQRQSIMP